MVQTTKQARKMIVEVSQLLTDSERTRFGRDLAICFNDIVTGTENREFKIIPADIIKIVREGGYAISKSLV